MAVMAGRTASLAIKMTKHWQKTLGQVWAPGPGPATGGVGHQLEALILNPHKKIPILADTARLVQVVLLRRTSKFVHLTSASSNHLPRRHDCCNG